VWAGANDFGNNVESNLWGFADGSVSVTGWADNVSNIVSTLHAAGARHFLVPNLPPFGEVPAVSAFSAFKGVINGFAMQFNTRLATDLASLANSDASYDIKTLDIYSLFHQVIANPGSYGLENVTGQAMGNNVDASKYLFWDNIHPTTAGHSLVAQAAASVVPEPSMLTLLLISATAGGIVCRRRRWRAKRS
jgi:phospholipase/lecithinase/hemolysin